MSDKSDFYVQRSSHGPEGPYSRLSDEPVLGDGPRGLEYSYLDEGVVSGTLYYYRLEAIESGYDVGTLFGPYPVVASGEVPTYWLGQNVPNPFARSEGTTIRFSLAKAGEVEISIFDAAGRLVRRLEQNAGAGENAVHWDGSNGSGRSVNSGMYFYKIKAGDFTDTKKMMLVE
jgi:hypothetical protein